MHVTTAAFVEHARAAMYDRASRSWWGGVGRCLVLEEAHTLADVAATQGAVEQRLVAHQAAAHVAAGQEDDLGLEEKEEEEEEEERRQRTARPEQGSPLLCPS